MKLAYPRITILRQFYSIRSWSKMTIKNSWWWSCSSRCYADLTVSTLSHNSCLFLEPTLPRDVTIFQQSIVEIILVLKLTHALNMKIRFFMVLQGRIELPTSSLPMTRSTTELLQQLASHMELRVIRCNQETAQAQTRRIFCFIVYRCGDWKKRPKDAVQGSR